MKKEHDELMQLMIDIAIKSYQEANQEDWFKETIEMCGNSPQINFVEGFILAFGVAVERPELLELVRTIVQKRIKQEQSIIKH